MQSDLFVISYWDGPTATRERYAEVAEAGSLAFTGGTVWSVLLSGATCVFAGFSMVSLRRHRNRR